MGTKALWRDGTKEALLPRFPGPLVPGCPIPDALLSSLSPNTPPFYNPHMTELVECHSDYTYAERPVALVWEGERLSIVEIEARWRIPGGRRFRVRVEDGRVFELFYGELYDEWRIHMP